MSFYLEWERLAFQAYAQIPDVDRLAIGDAIVDLMNEGIPDTATPDGDGSWHLRAGRYVIGFTIDDDLEIYLYEIEKA